MPCGVPNQCSFAGVWAPDLPEGMTVYGMSYFYERPMQAKATHPKSPDAEVTPGLNPASIRACLLSCIEWQRQSSSCGGSGTWRFGRDRLLWPSGSSGVASGFRRTRSFRSAMGCMPRVGIVASVSERARREGRESRNVKDARSVGVSGQTHMFSVHVHTTRGPTGPPKRPLESLRSAHQLPTALARQHYRQG
jgi:hypothetical protein